jgi:elongation of very long chain fatty acids protein 7
MNESDFLFNSNNEFFITTVDYYLYQYWVDECDPRTKTYLLVSGGPKLLLIFMSIWLLFVTKIGPNLMANRKAFELRKTMFVYNIFMVISNAYFFVLSIQWLNYGKRLFEFEFPPRSDTSKETLLVIDQTVVYVYTKFIDLLDTIFFVLRKKNSQITFLHLYHHLMVPILGWVTLKLAPTVQPIAVFAILNTLVHVIMYSYYALAAFGPKIQKYLWWKKYITIVQLIQFALLITYGVFSAYLTSGWPKGLYWIGIY